MQAQGGFGHGLVHRHTCIDYTHVYLYLCVPSHLIFRDHAFLFLVVCVVLPYREVGGGERAGAAVSPLRIS